MHGRKLLSLLSEAGIKKPHAFANVYREVHSEVVADPRAFYHEYLNVETETLHFVDFAASLSRSGLAYICDARLATENWVEDRIMQRIATLAPERIQQEQLVDYVVNRRLRYNVLRKEGICKTDGGIDFSVIDELWLASPLTRGPASLAGSCPGTYLAPDSHTLPLTDPVSCKLLDLLSERWPAALPIEDCLSRLAAQGITDATSRISGKLEQVLARLWLQGHVEVRLSPASCHATVSEKPAASVLARHQAGQTPYVSSLRHTTVALGVHERRLIGLLDGSRNKTDLLEAMNAPEAKSGITADWLEGALSRLCRQSLLVS